MNTIAQENFLSEYKPQSPLRHDTITLELCQLALRAAQHGNVGVGAILIGPDGAALAKEHNRVLETGFRSDLHAEMITLNRLEALDYPFHFATNCTLYTSLEPCPMCMTRIIFAGIGTIVYVCADPEGGMVERAAALPPIFQRLMSGQNQRWIIAECSRELQDCAFEIWSESRHVLDSRYSI